MGRKSPSPVVREKKKSPDKSPQGRETTGVHPPGEKKIGREKKGDALTLATGETKRERKDQDNCQK